MAFGQEFLDELRARLELSQLVGRRVALKRKGREFGGLCPFHNEKTPSFTVNDQKGFFHCFGCGAHGDAVTFVMRSEGLSFPEAVEKLAREAGLQVPASTPAERERARQATTLADAVEKAAAWFEQQLWSEAGKPGLDYLRRRGLSDETIQRFRLGYAPEGRDHLKQAMLRQQIGEPLLLGAGLVIQPDDGRSSYDRFRGRVMFPIGDRRGRLIAFGGRIIGEGEPKYLNSPETALFHKGNNLYALSQARQAAIDGKPVIVAEGYMDVIALHAAGFTGAVAPLGTALTEEQLAQLWRLVDEPVLCFDGDNAGSRAAMRAAERALPLLAPGKSLRFVSLPAGEDPDSLIAKRGAAAFADLLASAEPLFEIVWRLESAGKPIDTPERRAAIEAALMRRIAGIADRTVQDHYRRVAREKLWQAFGQARRQAFVPRRSEANRRFGMADPTSGDAARRDGGGLDPSRRERLMLATLLHFPELLEALDEELARLPLADPVHIKLRQALLDWAHGHASEGAAGLDAGDLDAHLREVGLDLVAAQLRSGEKIVGRAAGEAEALWRHVAQLHGMANMQAEALSEAEKAWSEAPNEENWQRLQSIIAQLQRLGQTDHETEASRQNAGPPARRSV